MIRAGSTSTLRSIPWSLAPGYPLSWAILLVCAIYFTGASACLLMWLLTRNQSIIRVCFQEVGGPLLAVFAMVEAAAALRVWTLFNPREPLRTGWFFLAAAGSVHSVSVITRHLLGRDIVLNPLRLLPSAGTLLPLLDDFGRVLGGTLLPLVLLAGIFCVLRVYRRLGLLTRLAPVDYLPLLAAAAFLLFQFSEFLRWLPAQGRVTTLWSIDWATDPLFVLLFAAAIVLRRANVALRRGRLACCWTAYAVAIFLTCIGSLGIALFQGLYISQQVWSPFWLIWYPAGAAFALAPICQMETMHLALRSQHDSPKP